MNKTSRSDDRYVDGADFGIETAEALA